MAHLKRVLQPAAIAGIVVIGIALALYLGTLDNGLRIEELKGGDLVTHQYAQVQARPSNAPGYPLYTMGGWLWFHLGRSLLFPLFNPIEILSLYSTIWAIASLIVLYLLIRDVTGNNWPVAALTTLFYAFTYFFWYYSCSTEQYTSAVFQTLLMVLWAFRWERTRKDKYLYLLAFMTGLCLANLVTVLFILPPLLILIISGTPRVLTRPKLIVRCILMAILPLISYIYVYVRGAQHPEWWGTGTWQSAWAWFISFVGTQQGRDELTWVLGPLTAEFPGLIVWDMSIAGVVLGLVGWWLLGRRRGGFLFGSLAIYLAFSYIDRFGNWYQVFMPMYPLLAAGMAVTVDQVWRWAAGRRSKMVWRTTIMVGLGLLVVSRLICPDQRAFQRNRPDDDGLRPGRALLADRPPEGATVIGDADQFVSLAYLTEIWGERPDVHAERLSTADALFNEKKPLLYVTSSAAPLLLQKQDTEIHPAGHGAELVGLNFEPLADIPDSTQPLHTDIGNSLQLAGYRFEAGTVYPFHLVLYWRAGPGLDTDWSVSVRPTQNGELIPAETGIVQMDVTHPVLGLYAMSEWAPGELVRDDYVISFPLGRTYDGAQVVVYRSTDEGFENLDVVNLALFPQK